MMGFSVCGAFTACLYPTCLAREGESWSLIYLLFRLLSSPDLSSAGPIVHSCEKDKKRCLMMSSMLFSSHVCTLPWIWRKTKTNKQKSIKK